MNVLFIKYVADCRCSQKSIQGQQLWRVYRLDDWAIEHTRETHVIFFSVFGMAPHWYDTIYRIGKWTSIIYIYIHTYLYYPYLYIYYITNINQSIYIFIDLFYLYIHTCIIIINDSKPSLRLGPNIRIFRFFGIIQDEQLFQRTCLHVQGTDPKL